MGASHSMVLDFFLAQQQTFHSQAKGAANSLPHALCDIHSLALESSRLGSLGCRDKANFRLVHQSPFHHQLICIISMLRLIVVLNQWHAIRRTSLSRCFGGSFCRSRGCFSRVGCFGSRSSGRMSCLGSRCSCKTSSVCSLHGGQCLCQGSSRSCHHRHKKVKWTHRGGLGKQWCWGWKNEAINAGLLKLECTSLINKKHYPQTLPTPALKVQAFSKCCCGKGRGSRSSKVRPEQDVNVILRLEAYEWKWDWVFIIMHNLTLQRGDMTLQCHILVFLRVERFWGCGEGSG